WRCLSCHGRPAYCAPCLRASHSLLPLYQVEFLHETHYQKTWLQQVGVEIFCGHEGLPCSMQISRK
ncbi:hypothetical protein BD311DRAFT_669394, partial [Dichomitus squalens]